MSAQSMFPRRCRIDPDLARRIGAMRDAADFPYESGRPIPAGRHFPFLRCNTSRRDPRTDGFRMSAGREHSPYGEIMVVRSPGKSSGQAMNGPGLAQPKGWENANNMKALGFGAEDIERPTNSETPIRGKDAGR